MNANAVAKHYAYLTPEERFRLILAASGRGDKAERDRLAHASARVGLTIPDHFPHAHAFQDVAVMTFIELLEEAARYRDALTMACGEETEEEDDLDDEPAAEDVPEDAGERPVCQRFFDLALGAGFVLRTKAEGWNLFCERLAVPPHLLWSVFLGFDRLQGTLALAEKVAFAPEGYLRWLNRSRPAGRPERQSVPLTVEGVADATAEAFRLHVEWWGG
jgi:hypothetical protein